MDALYQSDIPSLTSLGRGKVRDLYSIDEDHLLIVTTDRLSAYDVVMPDPVPGKGEILTGISNFWFGMMESLIPNHLTNLKIESIVADTALASQLRSRSIIVKRLEPLPIEAVVRGYLIGSGWRDYQRSGSMCGIELAPGIEQAGKLSETLFTPATKAAAGDHDENISFARSCDLIGRERAEQVRDISIAIYERAANHARARGIIIADTKFEFGLDRDGRLFVIDEMLTPDSSRFWSISGYRTGISPPSFDKQIVRDYLDTLTWDKTAPGPTLPDTVLQQTVTKYREVFALMTGPRL